MTHKFGIHNKHKLDNERRRSVLPPYETLLSLGLQKGDIAADVGSVIVEWKKEETDYGPPLKHRLALEDVSNLVPKPLLFLYQ